MQVSILLLAAGQSRRMRGVDKLTEPIDGKPLLQIQAQRACATDVPVYVTVPDLDGPRAALLSDQDVVPVAVPDAASGLSTSIKAGLRVIPESHAVLISLADLVEIKTPDLQAVIHGPAGAPAASIWRGATADGAPGHPILISPALRPEFATLTGDTGGAAILKKHANDTHLIRLAGNRARLDLDTPEDWAAWRANAS